MLDNTFNLNTVIEEAKKIILKPVAFYQQMPVSGGLINPLIFVVVMGVVTGIILAMYSLLSLGVSRPFGFTLIIVFPIFAIIGSFIGAAILFVIWKLMGSEKNYEVAYRCVAYSFAVSPIIALISFIPYIAGIVKTLWLSFLFFTASVAVHKLKAQTAKVVFGVLAAIGVLWGVSSEHTARNLSKKMEKAIDQSGLNELGKMLDSEKMQEMTPEEMGQKVGEFLKGLEKATKEQ